MQRSEYEYYCPRCGDLHFLTDETNKKCSVCGHEMLETPHEYNLSQTFSDELLELGWRENGHLFDEKEQRLFDEIISKSPEFDIDLYNNKDSIKEQKYQEFKQLLESPIGKVKCPYCHSTNTTKISIGDRYIGTVNFAAFGKQWHCNSCGSDF